jgi:hypothetical protein
VADNDNGNHPPDAPVPPPTLPFQVLVIEREITVPGHGARLIVGMQIQSAGGGVPLSHLIEMPGESLPIAIALLQRLCEKYPTLTTDLCPQVNTRELTDDEQREQRPSGIVDPSGKPLKNVTPFDRKKH